MGVSRLRALGAFACMLALFAFAAFAYTAAQLEAIATGELIPEINAAAGIALAKSYAGTKTEDYLKDLAANGLTIGLRTAASGALSIIWTGKVSAKTMTEADLTAIINDAKVAEMVRVAAIDPIQVLLITKAAAALKTMATDTAATHESRLAAAKAYYVKSRTNVKIVSIPVLETAAVTSDSAELAYAAGETLGGWYLSFAPKTQAEYETLAISGSSEGLRVAGKVALTPLLLSTSVTDLETKLLDVLNIKSAEYRQAYQDALAYQFGL